MKTKLLAIVILFFAVSTVDARVDPEKLQRLKAGLSIQTKDEVNGLYLLVFCLILLSL